MPIPPRVSLVTLGVADLARSTAFYQALGWPLSPASTPEISFFRTWGGLLAVFPVGDLAADAGLQPGLASGFRGVTVGINLEAPEEVGDAMAAAVAAGATPLKPAAATVFGGHAGYFADPDGHVWEIVWNPAWPVGADQRPTMP
jgi:predicted lactoylglutathione lyase